MKVLFVCESNLNRSPTFFKWFSEFRPEHKYESAGTLYGYPNTLDEELLDWADLVVVMDMSQFKYININFEEYMDKVVVAGISDQYDVDDDGLIEIIKWWHEFFFKKLEVEYDKKRK